MVSTASTASNPPSKPKSKAEQEAQLKAARRAEQANILAGMRPLLEKDEQLLAFARARVAGGWRGKLNVGPEAFFAPFVNIALTERRFVVQHVRYPDGRPGGVLPHTYLFAQIQKVSFTEIETFGTEPAGRLIVHLENDLYVRLRLRGLLNIESAKTMEKLFASLTLAKSRPVPSPTQSICGQCKRILDQHYRFCPYCGTSQTEASGTHGITLATGTVGAEAPSTLPVVSETDLSEVKLETDFAYEREDRPASFGLASDEEDLEDAYNEGKIGDDFAAAEPHRSGHSAGTPEGASGVETTGLDAQSAEETLEPYAQEDLFASQTGSSVENVENVESVENGDGAVASQPESTFSFDTEMFDLSIDPFSPEEPLPTTSGQENAGVAFEQNEEQPFTELPFSDTPAEVEVEGEQTIEPLTAESKTEESETEENKTEENKTEEGERPE